MRRKKPFLIGFIVAVLFVVAWFLFREPSALEWMQRTSGVRLPRGVQDVSTYDDREHFVTAHVLLPAASVSEFARKYEFSPDTGTNVLFGLLGMTNLDAKFRTIPQNADLVTRFERSKDNYWIFVLDRRTGHLWFTVQYESVMGGYPKP